MGLVHINLPIQVTTVEQTGAAVAESFFGDAFAAQENNSIVNAAQQSNHFSQHVF